ncbi:MAG: Sensory/regulatory protein RpfC [Fibrobacterota bacterium]|jgi:CheY-like chemotaxis protein
MTDAPSRQSIHGVSSFLMPSSRPLSRLLDEIEQEFPAMSRGRPIRLHLQATQTLACQHLPRATDTKGLLLALIEQLIEAKREGKLVLHVHCLRQGIAFDFPQTTSIPALPIQTMIEELGAHWSHWENGLRLEFPREFSPSRHHGHESSPVMDFSSLHGHRVLVVEDDVNHRRTLSLSLIRVGARVSSCSHTDAGMVMALERRTFSALIIHIQHPVCTGLGIIEPLRDAGMTQPVVALASTMEPGDHELCQRSGCAALLTTHAPAHVLIETLASILQGRTPSRQGAIPTE